MVNSRLVVLIALCGLLSCTTVIDEEEVNGQEHELFAYSSFTPWPMPIHVCFVNETPATAADFENAKALFWNAMNESWAKYGNVVFEDEGDCPSNIHVVTKSVPERGTANPEWLVVVMTASGWGGSAGSGPGVDFEMGIGSLGRIQDVAVHEIGHVLGLAHEHTRAESVSCTKFINQLESCQDCLANAPCRQSDPNECNCTTVAHQNTCFTENGAIIRDLTDADIGEAEQILADLSYASGLTITLPDLDSVMNYCSGEEHGGTRHFDDTDPVLTDWHLSSLDAVGIEMLYPPAATLKLKCMSGPCFTMGNSVVALDDGVFSHSWIARGGWASTSTNSPTHGSTYLKYFLGQDFANGATVIGSTVTTAGESRSFSGTVETSSALYAAIARGLL